MNIQLSVLLWTIICFCLAMLILNKLLFKPLLQVMDARQERIDRARGKQKAYAEAYDQELKALEEAREAEKQQKALEAAAGLQASQEQAGRDLAAARQADAAEIEEYREQLRDESQELKSKLDAGLSSLAETFAERLAS